MEDMLNKISEEYHSDINIAINILKEAGCTEIYLFGSLAKGDVNINSDIDLAIRGCSSDKYFKVLGKLLLELKHPVDLINLDREDDFPKHLEKEGELVYVS